MMKLDVPPHLGAISLWIASACSAEARYQNILEDVHSEGAQLNVRQADGAMWSGAAGSSVTTDRAFLVGSNTKVLTAACVLQLVEEGSLSLDQSAATWVEGLDPEITIRDLLQHTSGLGEYLEHEVFTADEGAAMADVWTPTQLLNLGREVRDDGPQETAVYANTNYIALGIVIEAVEARPYATSLNDRVFGPLGMSRSGLLLSGDTPPEHLVLGEGGEWGEVTWVDASIGWAAGSAYTSADDLSRFYDALFAGELFGPDLVAAQRSAVPADLGFAEPGVETAYGLGLMVVDIRGQVVVGHLGSVEGFTALVLRDEETGARSTLVMNTSRADFLRPSLKALKVAGSR